MLAMEKGINCCFSASASNVYIYFITIAIALVVIRVSYVIYRSSKPLHTTSPQPLSTLIVLGSGLLICLKLIPFVWTYLELPLNLLMESILM